MYPPLITVSYRIVSGQIIYYTFKLSVALLEMANLGKRQLARKNINISQSIRTYGTSLKAPLSEKKNW